MGFHCGPLFPPGLGNCPPTLAPASIGIVPLGYTDGYTPWGACYTATPPARVLATGRTTVRPGR